MAHRHTNQGAQFHDMAAFRRFALAGDAVFTVVSKRTGTRFTYRIQRPRGEKNSKTYFCKLLNGPDNTSNYAYFGLMFGPGKDTDFQSFRHGGATAKVALATPSVSGFAWLLRHVMHDETLDLVEIWHQGRCGKCRKPLTVPESIESGLGPVCAKGGRD